MSRYKFIVALICLPAICVSASIADEQGFRDWQEYLAGSWEYEISPTSEQGRATWRLAAKGHAMIGRFVDSEGAVSVELSGWDAHKKAQIATGFGSDGTQWTLTFRSQTPQQLLAKYTGRSPDGKILDGDFVGERVDDDKYIWTFEGTADGEPFSMNGVYNRVSPGDQAASTDNLAEQWSTFFTGNWERAGKRWTEADGWVEANSSYRGMPAAGGMACVLIGKAAPEGMFGEWVCNRGWSSLTQSGYEFGTSANGASWTCQWYDGDETSLQGKLTAALPGGTKGTGSATITRLNDDSYENKWELKLENGETLKGAYTNTRH